MKTDLYTKIVLTALTLGVFALVFQRAEFDLSPVSTVEAKGKQVAHKAKVINGKIYRLVGYWTGEVPGRLIGVSDNGDKSLLFATLSDCQEGARYWTQRDQKKANRMETEHGKGFYPVKLLKNIRSRRYACVSVQPTFAFPWN